MPAPFAAASIRPLHMISGLADLASWRHIFIQGRATHLQGGTDPGNRDGFVFHHSGSELYLLWG